MTASQSLPLRTDERLVVGCYTDPDGHGGLCVSPGAPDGDTAGMHAALALPNASWVVPHCGGLLACCELAESRLVLLAPDGDGFRVVCDQPTGGADACHLAVSPGGRWVAVANYTSGQVTLFAAPDGSTLEPRLDVLDLSGSGPVAGRQDSAHAHQAIWLDDDHLLVTDLGSDLLRIIRVDDGRLVELAPVVVPAGTGPRHGVLRTGDDGQVHLAVCGELSGEVVALRHEGQAWDQGWWVVDHVPGSQHPGALPSGLRFLGDDLVLANRHVDTVSLLRWRPDGRLTLVAEAPCGGRNPRDLVVHDAMVWVANQDSGAVTVLSCAADEFGVVASAPVTRPASLAFVTR